MKRFKVKDLMIDVLPVEREEVELEAFCPLYVTPGCYYILTPDCYHFISPHQCYPYYITCRYYHTPYCFPHYITCRYYRTPYCYPHYITPHHCYPYYITPLECPADSRLVACPEDSRLDIEQMIDPRELGILREQLRASLEQVEAAEQRVAGGMAPQTLEEVELLRGKLKEAMAELDAMAKGME